jgi:carbamoyltransferase
VALNCSGNGRLAQQEFVDQIFVQPASHDAGTALGAAILAHRKFTGKWPDFFFPHAYWGPSYSSDRIKAALDFARVSYDTCDPIATAAEALARNEIVGWYQGRTEVGPRALGCRSILAHPGIAQNLDRVNRVKRREEWRPLAPSVLAERYQDIFELRQPSPFMLLAGQVRADWRDRLPAVVHVDGSARPQMVSAETNPAYYNVIKRFEQLTGLPAVLNTSFNHNDEPLVVTITQTPLARRELPAQS